MTCRKRFWDAVWGYWDMPKVENPMDEQTRFDILYDYGCKAQELEAEFYKLKEAANE